MKNLVIGTALILGSAIVGGALVIDGVRLGRELTMEAFNAGRFDNDSYLGEEEFVNEENENA